MTAPGCFSLLLSFVLLLLLAESGNHPRKLSSIRQEQGIARGVGQHHVQRSLQAKPAGRIPETSGPARHLIRLGEVADLAGIYANRSPRDVYRHQASVAEAEYALTLGHWNVSVRASACNGQSGHIIPAQRAVRELSQATVPGQFLLAGDDRVRPL